MSAVTRPFKWFYHEFGIVSIHQTGRNAYLIILARTCRMFAFGVNSLILAIFMSALNFTDHRIGLFMTLTLLGDVFLGTFLTLIADKIGRRRVLMGGSVMMIMSGVAFAFMENFWILLIAAIFGVISVTGGDFGPFRSIEESVISQLTTPSTRADVLAWYVATSTLGSSLGSEVSGRIIHILQNKDGWRPVDAYHTLFWIYAAMGIVNAGLVLALTDDCELNLNEKSYSQVPQDENDHSESIHQQDTLDAPVRPLKPPTGFRKVTSWLSHRLILLSPQTRSIMFKLWFLLGVDALADGMVPYSLTNYYMDIKFHPAKSTLGDITSVSYFIAAISSTFAGPLARKIGLINTMVFTHVPSSAAVLLFPFPPFFWMTAALLLIRTALNPMDQAPRSAFIAAVVKPQEVTAAMGITNMVKTLASMAGPSLTGILAAREQFWIAFVVAGSCRLAYDFGLWALFVNVKVDQGDYKSNDTTNNHSSRREPDEEENLEMQSLADSDDSFEMHGGIKSEPASISNNGLQTSSGLERVRSRSPHRATNSIG